MPDKTREVEEVEDSESGASTDKFAGEEEDSGAETEDFVTAEDLKALLCHCALPPPPT